MSPDQSTTDNPSRQSMRTTSKLVPLNLQQHILHSLNNKMKCLAFDKGGKSHLRQESLAHEIHAPDIQVHCEIPVSFFTVQDGAMVHKPVYSTL